MMLERATEVCLYNVRRGRDVLSHSSDYLQDSLPPSLLLLNGGETTETVV